MSSMSLSSANSVSRQQNSKRKREDTISTEREPGKASRVWEEGAPQLADLASFIKEPCTFAPKDQRPRCSIPLAPPLDSRHTSLIRAIQEAHPCVLPFLLTKAAEFAGEKDEGEWSPLMWAAYKGDIETIKALIKAGHLVNSFNKEGDSALAVASKQGNFDVVWLLIKEGAACSEENLEGVPQTLLMTWVMECCKENLPDPLDHLLQLGVVEEDTVSGCKEEEDDEPLVEAPLEIAVRNNYLKVAKVLFEHGVYERTRDRTINPPNLVCEVMRVCNIEMLGLFLEFRSLVGNGTYKDISEFLRPAIFVGEVRVLEYLFKAGAKINYQSDKVEWEPPIIQAVRNRPRLVKFLLDKGADPNLTDHMGHTALFYAIENRDFESIRQLVKAGTDVDKRDRYGWTLYGRALDTNNFTIIKIVTGKSKEQVEQDREELLRDAHALPVIIVSIKHNLGIVKSLLDRGVNPDLKDKEGRTALFYAIEARDLESIEQLIKAKADVNAKDRYGWTPYRLALQTEDPDVIQAVTGKNMGEVLMEQALREEGKTGDRTMLLKRSY